MNGYEGMRATTQDDKPGDRRSYQTQIGKIMYSMVYTRPDICYTMSRLSQYMSDPNIHHELALHHLLRYLRHTYKLRLRYGPTNSDGSQEFVRIYSDLDYGADIDDR